MQKSADIKPQYYIGGISIHVLSGLKPDYFDRKGEPLPQQGLSLNYSWTSSERYCCRASPLTQLQRPRGTNLTEKIYRQLRHSPCDGTSMLPNDCAKSCLKMISANHFEAALRKEEPKKGTQRESFLMMEVIFHARYPASISSRSIWFCAVAVCMSEAREER